MRVDFTWAAWLDRIRESFWFVPAILAVGGMGAAWAAIVADRSEPAVVHDRLGPFMAGGADGAVNFLASLAGSTITVTGVVFSVTILTLTLASSQFGPRLLRTFRRDRANQVVLGTFVATYGYCLVALMNSGGDQAVLRITVAGAFLLTVVSIGMFIFFIHHVAVAIQADTVIASVASELHERVDRVYPDKHVEHAGVSLPDGTPLEVCARKDGYVQSVAAGPLSDRVHALAAVVHITVRPGDFVVAGEPLATAWGAGQDMHDLGEAVHSSVSLGARRTGEQDVDAGIRQLVEVASRALSPGINDPSTAMACIDRINSVLCTLAARDVGPVRLGRDGRLRVVLARRDFPDLVESAFDQLRRDAEGQPLILRHLLSTLRRILARTSHETGRQALLRQAHLVAEAADTVHVAEDAAAVRAAYAEATRMVGM